MTRTVALQVALMAAVAVGVCAEEEKEASKVSCAMAATLLGAVGFQMYLFYVLNHHDKDMREYAYKIISSTVSIFCAVLLFQSINGFLEAFFLDGLIIELQLVADMAHMMLWLILMQIALAYYSGAMLDGGARSTDAKVIEERRLQLLENECNIECWAILLAHMAGFAAINAFGTMQQLPFFSQSPMFVLLTVPIAMAAMWIVQRCFAKIRYCITMHDESQNLFELAWEEETADAENDVMGLAISFLTTQALRFLICGSLANQEGEEEEEVASNHQLSEVFLLAGCGLLSIGLMAFSIYKEPEETEDESAEQLEADEVKERFLDSISVALIMTFAWCFFFSGRWLFGTSTLLQTDPMVLALALALVFSIIAFSCIRLLDCCNDSEQTSQKFKKASREIITAIGILVGFSWEQCFDTAVGALASRTPHREFMRLGLAAVCVVVLVPAWKKHILPMVIYQGYVFGVVLKDDEQLKLMREAFEKKEEEERASHEVKYEKLKKIEELHRQNTGVYSRLPEGPP